MKISELFGGLFEWGRVVQGVNTTPDVAVGEIARQAAKFGNVVGPQGGAPLVGKDSFKKKGAVRKPSAKRAGTKSLFANGSMKVAESEAAGMLDFWGLAAAFGVEDEAQALHDATIPWANRNDSESLAPLLADPKMVLASKLRFFWRHVVKAQKFSTEAATPEMFRAALRRPVTLWRGGGGAYRPSHRPKGRSWVSFTADRGRSATFSEYDGTQATRDWMLPKRDAWWVVELTVPMDSMLLYIDAGYDDEVIVSCEDAKRAELITRHPSARAKRVGGDRPAAP